MKRKLLPALFLLAILIPLTACDEKVDYKKEEGKGLKFNVDQDLQDALKKNQMPKLASRLGCITCHSITHRVVGPAWEDVAKRYRTTDTFVYKGKSYPLVDGLVQKISHGGVGNWGEEKMPGIDPSGEKHDMIEKLVRFILKLGKK